jgi:hypothetical protein
MYDERRPGAGFQFEFNGPPGLQKEQLMKLSVMILGAAALSAASADLMAEEQVGVSPMLCAVTLTVSCDSAGDCIEGPASAVNLPVFVKFDPESKSVESARESGDRRTSNIDYVADVGDSIVLLGDEQDSGWSATVTKSTGDFTATISEQGMGYIIFGSCLSD